MRFFKRFSRREHSIYQRLSKTPYVFEHGTIGCCFLYTRCDPGFLCLHDWLAMDPDWTSRISVTNRIVTIYSDLHERGIYHVDMKPDHIFVTADGDHVRIIDFDHSVLRGRFENPGWTLPYIAPEIHQKMIDWEKWDLFVLGLMITYILTGQEHHLAHHYIKDYSIKRILQWFREEMKYSVNDLMDITRDEHCVDLSLLLQINPADRRLVMRKNESKDILGT